MIIISTEFLSLIGLTSIPHGLVAPGVYVTAGSVLSRDTADLAIAARAKNDAIKILLVGVVDRDDILSHDGEIAADAATLLCCDAEGAVRRPWPADANRVLAALETGLVVGPLVPIVEALRRIVQSAQPIRIARDEDLTSDWTGGSPRGQLAAPLEFSSEAEAHVEAAAIMRASRMPAYVYRVREDGMRQRLWSVDYPSPEILLASGEVHIQAPEVLARKRGRGEETRS